MAFATLREQTLQVIEDYQIIDLVGVLNPRIQRSTERSRRSPPETTNSLLNSGS